MTNLSTEAVRPDKTDKPYSITNTEFLQAIYRDLPDGVRGMIVSSAGNPNLQPDGYTLLEYLGLTVADTRTKPTIHLVQGEIHHIVECAEKELADTGRYYNSNIERQSKS